MEETTSRGAMLKTRRLRLRPWRQADLDPFAAMNADPEVMRYFPTLLDRAQSDALAGRIDAHLAEHGWGLWAVEERDGTPFIGFVGLARQTFEAPFTPCVEVGWRLARPFWGQGYATEAAEGVLRYAFDVLCLDEVVSMTSRENLPSLRVMQKLGMRWVCDFDHPRVPEGHPLRPHVLLRIDRATFAARCWQQPVYDGCGARCTQGPPTGATPPLQPADAATLHNRQLAGARSFPDARLARVSRAR